MRLIALLIAIMAFRLTYADETERLLEKLDYELGRSQQYTDRKEARLDSLKRRLAVTHEPAARYRLLQDIIHDYNYYHIDSTAAYLRQAERLARDEGRDDWLKEVTIREAWNDMQRGDLIHPMQVIDTVDVSHGPDWLKSTYYDTRESIYIVLLSIVNDEPTRQHYIQQLSACRDSAFAHAPQNWMLHADLLAGRGQLQAAIDTVQQRISTDTPPIDGWSMGVAYHFLARVYGDIGDRARRKEYLVRSALCDLQGGVREYASLTELAVMLYGEGDTRRAYHYIGRSMQDANAAGSRLRMVQISDNMPVITASYISQGAYARRLYRYAIGGFSAFAILLGVLLALLVRRHRQTLRQRQQLEEQRQQLHTANITAQTYVTAFSHLSLDYLKRMETFRKRINKVAQHRNFDELFEAVRAGRDIAQEEQMFYNCFDEAFLHIHPRFISQFNALLRPDAQLTLPDADHLTTELRIYALIHLGVTDSQSIAQFLRCSNSTVYNYRTQMRNRALNRDTFDAAVQAIS